jgi:hypothetical protein
VSYSEEASYRLTSVARYVVVFSEMEEAPSQPPKVTYRLLAAF